MKSQDELRQWLDDYITEMESSNHEDRDWDNAAYKAAQVMGAVTTLAYAEAISPEEARSLAHRAQELTRNKRRWPRSSLFGKVHLRS